MRAAPVTFAIAIVGLISPALAQRIHTVNASGPGSTPPWDTALPTLQQALSIAIAGDEVWVAAGTYRPSMTDPNASFIVPSGVILRGGFAGTEQSAQGRSANIAASATILAGRQGTSMAGTYVVLKLPQPTPGTMIDRVTITGGRGGISNSVNLNQTGASGLRVLGGTLEVVDCTIIDNIGNLAALSPNFYAFSGAHGGGIGAEAANLTLRRCLITQNSTAAGSSGGCVSGTQDFSDRSGGNGGGVFVSGGTLTLEDCTVSLNIAGEGSWGGGCALGTASNGSSGGQGGGIYALNAAVRLVRCSVNNNRAGDGGGVIPGLATGRGGPGGHGGGVAVFGGSAIFESSQIQANVAGAAGTLGIGIQPPAAIGGSGGGVYINNVNDARFLQCVIADNRSGAGANGTLSATTPNSPFSCGAGGGAAGTGAGIAVSRTVTLTIAACTIANNIAGPPGIAAQPTANCSGDAACCGTARDGPAGIGGLSFVATQFPSISGSIFWGNVTDLPPYAQPSYACAQSAFPGIGNISADPMFVNAAGGNYRLQPGSPAINAGSNTRFRAVAPNLVTDADGRPRFAADTSSPNIGEGLGPIIDMGAFERSGCEADVTGDGQLTPADLLEFLARWFAGDPRTNLNGSGEIDVADLFVFMNMWFMGC